MRTRLLPCLLGAVALHAAALGWLAHGALQPGGDGRLPRSAAGRAPAPQRVAAVQVALRPARPAAAQAVMQAAGPAEATPRRQTTGQTTVQTTGQTTGHTPEQTPEQTPGQTGTGQTAAPLSAAGRDARAAAQAAPPQAADEVATAAARGGPDADGYVPRPLLTTAPTPTQDIALPFPLDFAQRGRFAGILTLYIEADGRVSRVVVEGASLPPQLARVAKQAFSGTRFTPGQVAQRIVKSRIRVEVVFENAQAA